MVSVDGVLGRKTKVILHKPSRILAAKWELSPFQAHNYVNTQMSVAIVRDTHVASTALVSHPICPTASVSPFYMDPESVFIKTYQT